MSELQFEGEEQYAPRTVEKPLLVRWVLATGLVSDDRGAHYVLLGFVVLCLALAAFFFSRSGGNASHLSPSDIQRITDLQKGASAPSP